MEAGQAVAQPGGDAEALLIERARDRSPTAWSEIYDATYRKLFRYCYARTSNQAIAAELASQVYLDALESIDRYVYRGRPLLAWLYRIARNVVADHLRARERESRALERAAQLDPPAPAAIDLAGDRHDIEVALRRLTEEQQQVISLRYFSGFSTAEIAAAMERSERAIYSLEVRALAALRRQLAPRGIPPRAKATEAGK